ASFDPIAVLNRDAFKPVRRVLLQMFDCVGSDWLLDCFKNRTDIVVRFIGIDQKVHMVWHEHIGPKREVMFLTRSIDGVGQPLTGAFGSKKGKAAKAGKRQFMHMSRFV